MRQLGIQQNVILRLLQTNNSPRAQSALRAFRKTQPTRPPPDVIIMDPDSKPRQVWLALQQVVLCGRNDEASQQLALGRLDENEDPTVRAQALLLAVNSGLGEQVRPIALEMTETTARSSFGTHMYVLLATAQLVSPDELQALIQDQALQSSEVDVIMLAAQFYHAGDNGKDALMREAAHGRYRDESWLKRLFFRELLQRGHGESLIALGYIRRGRDGGLLITEDDQRLIGLLGYEVSADGAGIKVERVDCW